MNCYNCGKYISWKEKTKEHIPAKSLFSGYSEEYKINRITVSACNKCNNEYSKIDNELRDAIGVTNENLNDESARELSRKSVKSILARKNANRRLFFNKENNVSAVKFNYSKFRRIVIKDFKGIFHFEFGFPISNEWKIELISEFEQNKNIKQAIPDIFQFLASGIDWSISGHKDIFKYKFKLMFPRKDGIVEETDDLTISNNMACVQFYHGIFGFIVIATRRKWLNSQFPILARKKRK